MILDGTFIVVSDSLYYVNDLIDTDDPHWLEIAREEDRVSLQIRDISVSKTAQKIHKEEYHKRYEEEHEVVLIEVFRDARMGCANPEGNRLKQRRSMETDKT